MSRSVVAVSLCVLSVIALGGCGDAEQAAAAPVTPATPAAGAEGSVWLEDFNAAAAAAKASDRLILADFQGSDWCPSCKILHEKVFATQRFLNWAGRSVVLFNADLPQDRTHQPLAIRTTNEALVERHGIAEFPTVLILDASGAKLAQVMLTATEVENITPSSFIALAEAALASARKAAGPGRP
jgi:thiol:disulfide interchange protein